MTHENTATLDSFAPDPRRHNAARRSPAATHAATANDGTNPIRGPLPPPTSPPPQMTEQSQFETHSRLPLAPLSQMTEQRQFEAHSRLPLAPRSQMTEQSQFEARSRVPLPPQPQMTEQTQFARHPHRRKPAVRNRSPRPLTPRATNPHPDFASLSCL